MKFKFDGSALMETNLPGKISRGKVRDIYDLGDKLVIVATDRISAFDVVMASGIPHKGVVLTNISRFWFDFLMYDVGNHMIGVDVMYFPEPFRNQPEELAGRSMVKKAEALPVECVVRDYLAGSGWKEYSQSGTLCGQKLPEGLRQCGKLPKPIFTPATKFEWGRVDGKLILIDEVLTPDSSRFWPADQYEAGRDQESFDKQFVRNYLESIHFDKSGPGVELPEEIRAGTSDKYLKAFERLSGKGSLLKG